MERLEIHITRDKKVKKGKGARYNTIIIELNKIKEREYKSLLIGQIEDIEHKIDRLRTFTYRQVKQRKVIEKVNDMPVHDVYNSALVGVIKRNERARKEIELIKELLK